MKATHLLAILILSFSALAFADTQYQKPSDAIIKSRLTTMQYYVTQEQGTEPAFDNAYWNNEKPGIYVDVVTGEPLFSSLDKYDSHTGWPSFTKPLEPGNIILRPDNSFGMDRTEVISKTGHSHLGHLFDDGPPPSFHRFCMNSAALEFIPVQDMQKRGYGQYMHLFQNLKPKLPVTN